jgi:ribonucleoside-diphosphate reductase alpha subunit
MNKSDEMHVIKRNGKSEDIAFDKILQRVRKLGLQFNLNIPYSLLVMKVIDQLYNNITTEQIDILTAEQCTSMSTIHPDYSTLAALISISNLHKKTNKSFYNTMKQAYEFKDINGKDSPIINHNAWNIIQNNKDLFDNLIDHNKDYLIDYFGFKTLERAYLIKVNNKIIERPQYMFLRVAICIHGNNIEKVKETYKFMSEKWFTHATPTLFNACTMREQLSSCYLIAMEDDSIDGIYNTLKECAKISKWAGGIGLHIHNIRATGSHIRGTNGTSNGIVPMLKVFNSTARYVDQGGGKRNGSIAIYIEPHHADIETFLELKKNHGDEESKARDLFYALWISDLFMERIQENQSWSLFCPDSAPGLSDVYGDKYKELYCKYENEKLYIKQIPARDLWVKILESQMETGTPYILFKDACNEKSNQKNLGTIKSSNLCTEIIEYSNENETAVCNLASIALPKFIIPVKHNLKNVHIYTKENCIWCTMLKNLLNKNNITFNETILDNESFEIFKIETNLLTVPQLYNNHNTELIGGFKKCLELLRPTIDYNKLHKITKILTENLNNVIDINFYPTEKTKRSNILHRPIGIGVQGLADLFIELDLPFNSEEAKNINKNIFETIYHAALEKSCELSKERIDNLKYLESEYNYGNWTFKDDNLDICTEYNIYNVTDASITNAIKNDDNIEKALRIIRPNKKEISLINTRDPNLIGAYSSFEGSPASQGILQYDMWNVKPSSRYDWNKLKKNIKKYGLRNSLLIAPMPTASTSQILGYNECFEPYTSNIYTRRTLAGEFILVNKKLMKELIDLNLWNEEIKNNIIANKGSVQYIYGIPDIIKEKYKIVWELPMKDLIDMARDRGAFICQSQSFNLWMETPSVKALTNMHFYSWKSGLKTGIYYLRRKAQHQAQQFTIEPEKKKDNESKNNDQNEGCLMCSG